ncbi:avidin/streptavidin family protein [Longimicrobium sp.]|uniref:avidin/streptavidin family protein n=1 Tax=Longimicrobium sp. TaxID=2029185 RepID=UPI003B3A7259
MAIDGMWYNELGSLLTITSSGTTISGTYQTAVGNAQGIYNLTGYINADTNPSVGWVVLWSNEYGDSNSLTTWAGQYYDADGSEVIITMWLLRSEEPQQQNWQSTLVGEDVFYRSQEQAKSSGITANLRRPAHPVS